MSDYSIISLIVDDLMIAEPYTRIFSLVLVGGFFLVYGLVSIVLNLKNPIHVFIPYLLFLIAYSSNFVTRPFTPVINYSSGNYAYIVVLILFIQVTIVFIFATAGFYQLDKKNIGLRQSIKKLNSKDKYALLIFCLLELMALILLEVVRK